ncbi:TIGR03943 family putative permease subunit [Spirillospora albida]|uniref:TIGR03943 family putative permease subunit n=1 Tax=Spirillospora albida TaxID=58123 RepID=UPI0004C1E430|nr:TIGR03943 family protein [Spirillospora albida]
MTRAMQNLLMVLLGGAVLWITLVTGEVVRYVKPGLRHPLVACAAVLIVLGAAGIRRDWRDDGHPVPRDGHEGHHHGPGGPRVAWLLCLPVVAIFAIAPPELGLFTAVRAGARPAAPPPKPAGDDQALPPGRDPFPLSIGEFMLRVYDAHNGRAATLTGRRVELTGFVTPGAKGGWSVTRLQLNCCAADAIALRVAVLDAPAPANGRWVKVVGVWQPGDDPQGDPLYQMRTQKVTPTRKPGTAYE